MSSTGAGGQGGTGAAAAAVAATAGTAMVKMEPSAITAIASAAAPTRCVVAQPPPQQLKPPAETLRGPLYGKQPGTVGTVGTGAGAAVCAGGGAVGLGVVVGRTPGNGPLHGNTGASTAGVGGGRPSIGAAQPQPQKSMPYTPHPHQVRAAASTTTAPAAPAPVPAGGYPSITPGAGTVAKMQQQQQQQQQQATSTARAGATCTLQSQVQQQAKTSHGPPSARQNLQQSGLFSQYTTSADGNGPPNTAALNDVTMTSNVCGLGGAIKPQPHQELCRPGTARGRPSLGAAGNSIGQPPFASQQQQYQQSQLQSQHQQAQGMKRQLGQEGGDVNKRPALGGPPVTATNPYNV